MVDGVARCRPPYRITVIGGRRPCAAAMIPGGVADAVARDGGTVIVDEDAEVDVDVAARPADDASVR